MISPKPATTAPDLKKITIHTDGGCHGNPGPGGWAAVLEYGSVRKEISGGCPATTNNRMEMQAAIEALRCLKQPCAIDFWTDSEYLKDGITLWISTWKRKGWRTKERKPVRNADLWQELDRLIAPHRIFWHWLKGHAGHVENERCDILAQLEIEKIRGSHSRDVLKKHLEQFNARRSAAEQVILNDKPADPQAKLF